MSYAKPDIESPTLAIYAIIQEEPVGYFQKRAVERCSMTRYIVTNKRQMIQDNPHALVFPSSQAAIAHLKKQAATGIPGTKRFFVNSDIPGLSYTNNDDIYIASQPIAYSLEGIRHLLSGKKSTAIVPITSSSILTGSTYVLAASSKDGFDCARRPSFKKRRTSSKKRSIQSLDLHLLENLFETYNKIIDSKVRKIHKYHSIRNLRLGSHIYHEPPVRTAIPSIPHNSFGAQRTRGSPLKEHNREYFEALTVLLQKQIGFMIHFNLYTQKNKNLLRKALIPSIDQIECAKRNKSAPISAKELLSLLTQEAKRFGISGITPIPKDYPPCPSQLPPQISISLRPPWKQLRTKSRPRIT